MRKLNSGHYIVFRFPFFFCPCPNVLLFKWGETVKKRKKKERKIQNENRMQIPPKTPTWGFSELFTFFPSNPRSTFFRKKVPFILDPRRIRQYLPVCHRAGTNLGTSGLPLFHNPYVLSSVSSRAVSCLVGVRRAVPGCSLKMIRILFAYEPWLVDIEGEDLADAVSCPHRHA